MRVTCSTLRIPGADTPLENPLPRFRDPEHHKTFASDGTLSPLELERLGEHTGFRILPYCVQDDFTQNRTLRNYKTLVLENEILRAEFLPQFGGRLYSLFDKEKGRELLFKNPVFQPANLAIRNAWFSGGVEWNVAQTGHTYSTCDDVYFSQMKAPSGESFLRLYDYVRTTGLFWQVDFHLPSGSRSLYAHVRILNDQPISAPLYWWTNIAIPEEKRVRVFSCTKEAIYINPDSLQKEDDIHRYGHAQLPTLPSMPSVDVTYPQDSDYTNEFFFQNSAETPCPWEAAAYDDGFLFLERSTQPLRTRKMFCWGRHFGGRNWLDHLSEPDKGAYVEIQAGLAPTQIHGMDIGAGETVEFTQAFSCATLSSALTHVPDWERACQAVEHTVEETLSAAEMEEHHMNFIAWADLPCGERLHLGHGWGALEEARRNVERENSLPDSMSFPTVGGGEEQRWLTLLTTGTMPALAPGELPCSWMTDLRWAKYLEQAVAREPGNNALQVHLGVLLYENGEGERAEACWRAAGNCAIARRNLSVALSRRGDKAGALEELSAAFAIQSGKELAREYLALLNQAGEYEQAWQVYQGLSPETAEDERVMITAATAALEVGAEDFLQKAFSFPFAVIREGENQMVDIWFRHQARLTAHRLGRTDIDHVEQELRITACPPKSIDFRLTPQ